MTFPPLETTMNQLLKKLGLILCFALTFAGQSFGQGALKVTQKADVKKSLQLVLSESHAAIAPNSLRSLLKTLTEEPHVAGTPADLKTAEFVRERLRSWGWSAEFVSYDVLLGGRGGTCGADFGVVVASLRAAHFRVKVLCFSRAWKA